MRLLIGSGILVSLALTTACTFVTQSAIEERKACLDIDGDGSPQEYGSTECTAEDIAALGLVTTTVDCDDNDPLRAPQFEEIAYDGIDNDCDESRADILDLDGDGYPGITPSQYSETGAEWPIGLTTTFDCNDANAEIYPDSTFEVPYDGIDTDCDGSSDYDDDGDGFVPDINPVTGEAHDPPYTGTLPTGDCNDNNPAVYPEALSDLPYDGVDTNCDCENDFDADGDGFMWNEAENASRLEDFQDAYGCVVANPTWGDCDDNVDTIYPGAPEEWYNGVDEDCGEDDDYDRDGDGFQLERLGAGSDCDDEDPSIYPGAVEYLGDAVDQDCDDGNDTAAFQRLDADWEEPRRPEVGWNGRDYLMFSGATSWVDNSGSGLMEQPGHAHVFDPADPFAGPSYKKKWTGASSSTDVLGEISDIEFSTNADGEVYIGFFMKRNTLHAIALRSMAWTGTTYSFSPPVLSQMANITSADPFAENIDVQVSPVSGDIVVVGCADKTDTYTTFLTHNLGTMVSTSGTDSTLNTSSCVLELGATSDLDSVVYLERPAPVDATDPAGPYPYFLNTQSGLTLQPGDRAQTWSWDGVELDLVREQGGIYAYYDATAGRTSVRSGALEYLVPNLDNVQVFDIDAHFHPTTGDLYLVAVTEDRGSTDLDSLHDLVLMYGTPGQTLNEVTIPMEPDLQPRAASIYVDDTLVWTAFSMWDTVGSADDVAWMMFGFPE
jgi:hypothetical protein